MNFNNPRFNPRPIYISASVESSDKFVQARFEHKMKETTEKILQEKYSNILNALVDRTIKFIVERLQHMGNKNSFIEKYAEEILNGDNLKIYYDGMEEDLPKFSINIKITPKQRQALFNPHISLKLKLKSFRFKKKARPVWIEEEIDELQFDYKCSHIWYRFVKGKTKPDPTSDIRVVFHCQQLCEKYPYYVIENTISNEVWTENLQQMKEVSAPWDIRVNKVGPDDLSQLKG